MDPSGPHLSLTYPTMPDTPPYTLIHTPDGWMLVDTWTGEIEDEFGDDEALARETLRDQNEA